MFTEECANTKSASSFSVNSTPEPLNILGREVHASQEFRESRIGAQGIEDRVHFELRHAVVALRNGELQVL